jgi:hypothetical protein
MLTDCVMVRVKHVRQVTIVPVQVTRSKATNLHALNAMDFSFRVRHQRTLYVFLLDTFLMELLLRNAAKSVNQIHLKKIHVNQQTVFVYQYHVNLERSYKIDHVSSATPVFTAMTTISTHAHREA